jgi:hypothetical protein
VPAVRRAAGFQQGQQLVIGARPFSFAITGAVAGAIGFVRAERSGQVDQVIGRISRRIVDDV